MAKSEPPTDEFRTEVQNYADGIDSAYLNLSNEQALGRANQEELFASFSKARAAHAVSFALSNNAMVAASEAIYEAASVVNNGTEILSIAEKILNGNH